MRELVQCLVSWHQNRYLDPEVWENFLRHHLDPTLMPAPSELQRQVNQRDEPVESEGKLSTVVLSFLCHLTCLELHMICLLIAVQWRI